MKNEQAASANAAAKQAAKHKEELKKASRQRGKSTKIERS